MKARTLNVLDINDEPSQAFETGKGRAKHFNVDKIPTWKEAQKVLVGLKKIPPPDLLLLDVSFNKDASVKEAVLDEASKHGNEIVPIGPFLALPFLNAKVVMGFAPYSAHLGDGALIRYPPFLIAIGLIAAKMNGSVVGSEFLSGNKGDNKLDTFIEDLNKTKRAGDTNKALEIAIELYRNNFFTAIEQKRLSLFKNKTVIENLNALFERLKTSEGKVEIPIDDGLEVMDSDGNQDCISIVSLFADVLSWNKWADLDAIDEIYDAISEAPEDLTVKAIKAVEYQDQEVENEDQELDRDCQKEGEDRISDEGARRRSIDEIIEKLYSKLSLEDKREILRLCILFANAHVWTVRKELVKGDVYDRLGIKRSSGQNLYLSWFGSRKRQVSSNRKNLVTKLKVEPLNPITPVIPRDDINCYFLGKESILSYSDHSSIVKYRKRYGDTDNPHAREEFIGEWERPYSTR